MNKHKKMRVAGFMLLFLSLPALIHAQEAKIIATVPLNNPSFEEASEGRPVGWVSTSWRGSALLEYAPAGRTGSRSVTIYSEQGTDAAWFQVVPVEPFTRYRLSGWIKTEGVVPVNGQGALLNIHDLMDVRTQTVTGTSDWTRVQCEFDTLGDSIQINCLFGGWGQAAGKAWYDDLTLEIIEKINPAARTITADVTIDGARKTAPISRYIYGQFVEHLGRCIYGGIWAEMLEDRKFYFPVPAFGDIWRLTRAKARVLADSPWKAIGRKEHIVMVEKGAFVGKHSPHITVPGGGIISGIYQDELGLRKSKLYTGYIYLSGDLSAGPIKISLCWGDDVPARETVIIRNIESKYRKYLFEFTAGGDTDNGRLEITAHGTGSLKIGTISLMPADNVYGFRKDTLTLLKQLNAPLYRWPGGNFVSGYDWRDGLGDRDRRPTRTNPAWTGIETNDVGIDEFIRFCRLINAEPMIAVNTGFGDAYSAAAEVEYANGSSSTPMGKVRAQNGHSEPFRIKWWCVGNEMFGRWQLGYMRLDHYVLKHNWIEEKMRAVDPDIKTIGVGEVGEWSKGMLSACSDHMNLISEHFYNQGRSDVVEHVRQIPNNIRRIADAHREYRNSIPELEGKDIRIALDEWNYWYGPHVYGELGTRYFLKDALGIAAGLHEYFRNSDLYFMANYAQTVNVIGCIKTSKTQAEFAATGLPLMLYRKEFGSIPVEVIHEADSLDITAAYTDDEKDLTIAVVNPSWDIFHLTFDLSGISLSGPAKTWIIAGDDPYAHNQPGGPTNVNIKNINATDLTTTVSIKPLSITLFRAEIR